MIPLLLLSSTDTALFFFMKEFSSSAFFSVESQIYFRSKIFAAKCIKVLHFLQQQKTKKRSSLSACQCTHSVKANLLLKMFAAACLLLRVWKPENFNWDRSWWTIYLVLPFLPDLKRWTEYLEGNFSHNYSLLVTILVLTTAWLVSTIYGWRRDNSYFINSSPKAILYLSKIIAYLGNCLSVSCQ